MPPLMDHEDTLGIGATMEMTDDDETHPNAFNEEPPL